MSTITTKDRAEIFHKDWGPKTAQPIVFHHGWPHSADDWDAQMLYFVEQGYRVIAHDRRGHGRSSQVIDGHDMDHYAADAAAVVTYLNLRDAKLPLAARTKETTMRRELISIRLKKAVRLLGSVVALCLVLSLDSGLLAQAGAQGASSSVLLPTGGGQALLDPSDTVFLFLDHQSGLFQTVKDIGVDELRRNVVMLAKLSTLLKIPVITSASEPGGPNGPLMPEIHQVAPHAVYVPRKGEVNAWDNEDFVRAVRATGRKTLIMAGVWTSVCVMFPALDAKAAGFKVYAVIDASGDPSEMASRATVVRFAQAGVIPTSTNAVLSETHRTWNRPEAAELGKLYGLVAPNFAAVMESYQKAQEGIKQQK